MTAPLINLNDLNQDQVRIINELSPYFLKDILSSKEKEEVFDTVSTYLSGCHDLRLVFLITRIFFKQDSFYILLRTYAYGNRVPPKMLPFLRILRKRIVLRDLTIVEIVDAIYQDAEELPMLLASENEAVIEIVNFRLLIGL